MDVEVNVDPGICNFPAKISAASNDGVLVDIELVTECESMLQLAKLIHEIMPIDAYQELGPKESLILEAARSILVTKGCCEACVVPAGICKAIQVAANLALPRDISMKILKKGQP
jgi:hypothetical protein